MTEIIDKLTEGETLAPSDEQTKHLINYIAILVRATKPEYGLNKEQRAHVFNRFVAIRDAHPEIDAIVLLEADKISKDNTSPFWTAPSDDVLNALHSADILLESLGIPKE